MELLLKKGANSILTDKDGYSPLHLAVESQNLVSLKLLLADIRAKLTPSGTLKIIKKINQRSLVSGYPSKG